MFDYIRDLKLRVKLMISFGLFATIFMSVVTVIFTLRLYDKSVENQGLALKNYAQITGNSISSGLDFGDKASVSGSFETIKGNLEYIIVYDAYGAAFASYFKNPKLENPIHDVVNRNITNWRNSKKVSWMFETTNMNCIVVAVQNSVGNEIGVLSMGISTAVIDDEFDQNMWFGIALLVTAVGLGLLVAFYLSRILVKPINQILFRLKDIAEGQGDLSKRIDISSRDEIGDLAKMFNTFVEKLHDLILQVAKASEQIGVSVDGISTTVSGVASGAEQQSNQATVVAVAAEEMSATIVQTSSNTSDAVRLSEQAKQATERGKSVVINTVDGLQNISQVVSESAQSMLELGRTVAQIGSVVEVINDIADQINLLSLNASIEAATAGEYGKGFSVVANEVKNLAENTTKSTMEISAMIEKIQRAMANAIRAMERGTSEVEKGRELGQRTSDSFDEILRANEHVREMITSISVSTQQQSHSAEEISKNIENIANITRDTAQGARQINGVTERLVGHSALLKTLVSRFKLEDKNGSHE